MVTRLNSLKGKKILLTNHLRTISKADIEHTVNNDNVISYYCEIHVSIYLLIVYKGRAPYKLNMVSRRKQYKVSLQITATLCY